MDKFDALTLFLVNALMGLILASLFFGPAALWIFALAATPVALVVIVAMTATRRLEPVEKPQKELDLRPSNA